MTAKNDLRELVRCCTCHGTGRHPVIVQHQHPCDDCQGTGISNAGRRVVDVIASEPQGGHSFFVTAQKIKGEIDG
jgi:DnaJ-class molecular chaperone